jgi:hypothetical protein
MPLALQPGLNVTWQWNVGKRNSYSDQPSSLGGNHLPVRRRKHREPGWLWLSWLLLGTGNMGWLRLSWLLLGWLLPLMSASSSGPLMLTLGRTLGRNSS